MNLRCVASIGFFLSWCLNSQVGISNFTGAGVLELQWTTRRIFSKALHGNIWQSQTDHQRATDVDVVKLKAIASSKTSSPPGGDIVSKTYFKLIYGVRREEVLFVEGDIVFYCFLMFFFHCVRWFNFANLHSFRCMLLFAGSILGLLQVPCRYGRSWRRYWQELLFQFPRRSGYGLQCHPGKMHSVTLVSI